MGVVVSKKNQDRTKKVQQTAAVVSALKSSTSKARTVSKEDGNTARLGANRVAPVEEKIFDYASYRKEINENSMEGLNADRSSVTYGLPELGQDFVDVSRSGTTGYWSPESTTVTVPYFGAWKNRVRCGASFCCLYCNLRNSVSKHVDRDVDADLTSTPAITRRRVYASFIHMLTSFDLYNRFLVRFWLSGLV